MIKPSAIILIILGFTLGWWGHAWFTLKRGDDTHHKTDVLFDSASIGNNVFLRTSQNTLNTPEQVRATVRLQQEQAGEQGQVKNPFTEFTSFLNAEKYSAAMDILADIERHIPENAARYRTLLITTLKTYLEQNHIDGFMELSNLYLSTYFDDVEVLLLLARFNKETDFHIEAVNIYQLAREYAYSLKMRTRVEDAFQAFILVVDEDLTSQADWYNLSQIYLQSEIVGLLKDRHKLRQAEVLVENGDSYHAKQILQRLLENSQLSEKARELLAEINGGADSILQENPTSRYTSSVQLEKRGNQYLIPLLFSEQSYAKLLIDTGASMTTLSEASFQRLAYAITYEELGSRMFSTANGVTKGRVLRVASLQLGEYHIENVMLAVLDFNMSDGVDGLLGMNLLGRFTFQIEQDKDLLLLSPR